MKLGKLANRIERGTTTVSDAEFVRSLAVKRFRNVVALILIAVGLLVVGVSLGGLLF